MIIYNLLKPNQEVTTNINLTDLLKEIKDFSQKIWKFLIQKN